VDQQFSPSTGTNSERSTGSPSQAPAPQRHPRQLEEAGPTARTTYTTRGEGHSSALATILPVGRGTPAVICRQTRAVGEICQEENRTGNTSTQAVVIGLGRDEWMIHHQVSNLKGVTRSYDSSLTSAPPLPLRLAPLLPGITLEKIPPTLLVGASMAPFTSPSLG